MTLSGVYRFELLRCIFVCGHMFVIIAEHAMYSRRQNKVPIVYRLTTDLVSRVVSKSRRKVTLKSLATLGVL